MGNEEKWKYFIGEQAVINIYGDYSGKYHHIYFVKFFSSTENDVFERTNICLWDNWAVMPNDSKTIEVMGMIFDDELFETL